MDKIFELVRKQQLVLWVGSGLSLSEGFPSGTQLTDQLYNTLSDLEKEEISKPGLLPDFSEEYVRLKLNDRKQLNLFLENIFASKRKSLKWHTLIANIPHIRTIITTNYDDLFEQAYGNEGIKIVNSKDISKIDNKKVEIFKAHGDLTDLSSIIITRSDYAKFFLNDKESSVFWTTIKERVSNKAILFIGYNLEDDNVNNILEKIWNELKEARKEVFLIAPRLKSHKVSHLKTKGVTYIDSKADIFIEKLYKNIQDNIVEDFGNTDVTPEVLRDFLKTNGLSPGLQANENNYSISSITPINGNAKGNLTLKFKEGSKVIGKLSDTIKGKQFDPVEMDADVLEYLRITINGINITGKNPDEYKIILSPRPYMEGKVDILYNDGFEFSNIEYKIFQSPIKLQLIITFKNATITAEFIGDLDKEFKRVDFSYRHTDNFEKLQDAIKIYDLLKRILQGLPFVIYFNGTGKNFKFNPKRVHDIIDPEIEEHINYFNLLKEIENEYDVQFTNIGLPTDEDINNINLAMKYAGDVYYIIDWDEEMAFDREKEAWIFDLLNDPNNNLVAEFKHKEIINIHNQQISLGYKFIQIIEPYIESYDVEGTEVIIKSKAKKQKIWYSNQQNIGQL